jgi:hypothetical protein
MVMAGAVDFGVLIFWRGGRALLQGVFEKNGVQDVVFGWCDCGGMLQHRGILTDVFWARKIFHFFEIYFWAGVDNSRPGE